MMDEGDEEQVTVGVAATGKMTNGALSDVLEAVVELPEYVADIWCVP